MKVKLGEKIREFRKQNGKTQEDLAKMLGVTCQAVSRWESNKGYPDVEIIPALANLFKVSIDELFGYNGERQKRINEIITNAEAQLRLNGDMEQLLEMLRDAVDEFPNEIQILFLLGTALSEHMSKTTEIKVKSKGAEGYTEYDVPENKKSTYINETIKVYERVLELGGIDPDKKASVVLSLVTLYTSVGQHSKAKNLALKQDTIGCCREFLLTQATVGKERSICNSGLMIGILRLLKLTSIWSIGTKESVRSSQYAIDILLSIVNVYKTVVDDENYGIMHSDLSDIYISCSRIADRMKDISGAKKYFDLSFCHKQEYNKLRENNEMRYTSRLFSDLVMPKEALPANTMAEFEVWVNKFSDELKSVIIADEKYSGSYEKWWKENE